MKERLGVPVVQRSLAESREEIKAPIVSGVAYINGQKGDKAGTFFDNTAQIEAKRSTLKYVSRGGPKLEKTMSHFGAELKGKICMDVGTSTGGFIDCMFQNGAVKVHSVDVEHEQLARKPRNDDRVMCMGKTSIRYVAPEDTGDRIRFASIDVSSIPPTKVLGPVKTLPTEDGQIVRLVRPQFGVGREKVDKKGVVRGKSVHLEAARMAIQYALSIGPEVLNLEYFSIKGPEGNIEYLLYFQNRGGDQTGDYDGNYAGGHGVVTNEETVIHSYVPVDPKMVVEEARTSLDK